MLARYAVDANLTMIAAIRQSARPNPAYCAKLARELRRHIARLRKFAAANPTTTIADCIRLDADNIESRLAQVLTV